MGWQAFFLFLIHSSAINELEKRRGGDKRRDGADGGFWMTRSWHVSEFIHKGHHSPCRSIRDGLMDGYAGGNEDEWNAPFIARMGREIGRTERYSIQPSPGTPALRVETNQTRTSRSPEE